jgi:hypothetical protein
VTPAIGASTVAGLTFTLPILKFSGTILTLFYLEEQIRHPENRQPIFSCSETFIDDEGFAIKPCEYPVGDV